MLDHRPASDPQAPGGLDGAAQRGMLAVRDWVSDGVLLSAAEFASRRGLAPSRLADLEAHGELFAVVVDGVPWYPAELLKLTQDDSAALCRQLAGMEVARKVIFLMRKHGALRGDTVAMAMARGEFEAAMRLARAWHKD